jgi:hypothetical protein
MGPKPFARWDQTCERAYLDCLIDAVKKGQRTDTGWKPEVISNAITTFRGKGLRAFTKQQFETKRDKWKKKWKLCNTILGITGFGYNEHTGCIEADKSAGCESYTGTGTPNSSAVLSSYLEPLFLFLLHTFNRAEQRV